MARGRRKEIDSDIRKLTKKSPYTYYVTLPKREIDRLKWRDNQKLTVTRYGKGFLIRDWKS